MFVIFKKVEQDWVEVETSTQSLEIVLLEVYDLGKLNPTEKYRIEEVTDLGKKIINFQ
jgi:hypothetical protein